MSDFPEDTDPPLIIKGLRRITRRRDLGEGLMPTPTRGAKRGTPAMPNPLRERREQERAQELEDAKDSPYFWWWVFLGESKDYRAARAGGAVDPAVAAVARDFGDVINRPFETWWFVTGRELFAQLRPIPRVRKLEDGRTLLRGESEQCVYLEVPLAIRRSTALRQINKILGEYYKADDGSRHNVFAYSRATRDINKSSKMRLSTFKQFYDVWVDRKQNPKSAWWETGERLRVSPAFINYPHTDPLNRAQNNRNMTLTVQRIYRKTQKLIYFAARGDFPRTK